MLCCLFWFWSVALVLVWGFFSCSAPCLLSWQWILLTSVWLPQLPSHSSGICTNGWDPQDPFEPSFLQTRQFQFFSLSSYSKCSSPLIIFVALYWTCSSNSRSFLCREALKEMQHSRSSLSSTEQRCRITSLNLLATVFLLVAFLATRVHCWLGVTFLLPGSQGPSPKSCFPAGRCLGYAGTQDYSSKLCISPFELQDIPLPTSVEITLLKGDTTIQYYQLLLSVLNHLQTCWGCNPQLFFFFNVNESCFPPGIATSPVFLLMKFGASLWDFSLYLVYFFWTNNLHLSVNYRLERAWVALELLKILGTRNSTSLSVRGGWGS